MTEGRVQSRRERVAEWLARRDGYVIVSDSTLDAYMIDADELLALVTAPARTLSPETLHAP